MTTVPTGPDGGEGGLSRETSHVRRQMSEFRELMKAGVFTDDQLDAMTRVVGSILSPSAESTNREKLSAYKTLLARAKLEHEITNQRTQLHGHIHVGGRSLDGIGTDVIQIAAELGINLAIAGESDPDEEEYIDGAASELASE